MKMARPAKTAASKKKKDEDEKPVSNGVVPRKRGAAHDAKKAASVPEVSAPTKATKGRGKKAAQPVDDAILKVCCHLQPVDYVSIFLHPSSFLTL